jgi:hypothetical protein
MPRIRVAKITDRYAGAARAPPLWAETIAVVAVYAASELGDLRRRRLLNVREELAVPDLRRTPRLCVPGVHHGGNSRVQPCCDQRWIILKVMPLSGVPVEQHLSVPVPARMLSVQPRTRSAHRVSARSHGSCLAALLAAACLVHC